MALLRQQQQRLAVVKAVKIFFGNQNFLRTILKQQVGDEKPYTVYQTFYIPCHMFLSDFFSLLGLFILHSSLKLTIRNRNRDH